MLAAVTPLPVIGVPVPLKHLDGMDSLLSIVQMPAGVPVATVAVGNARNAGLLAVRILGRVRRGAAAADGRLPGRAQDRAAQEKGAAVRRDAGSPERSASDPASVAARDRLRRSSASHRLPGRVLGATGAAAVGSRRKSAGGLTKARPPRPMASSVGAARRALAGSSVDRVADVAVGQVHPVELGALAAGAMSVSQLGQAGVERDRASSRTRSARSP